MAKRKNAIEAQASRNPSVVLRAFAPETEYTLTLDGWIFLESMDSPLTNGGRPGTKDLVIAMLVMTDENAVFDAKKMRKIDELVAKATKGKRPADVIAYGEKVAEAIKAAFDPADSGAAGEKKSSAAPDGGSPSSE